jgi:hypothetical protein
MNEPMWIAFPTPVKMVIEFPYEDSTKKIVKPMLAWRWDHRSNTCQYLEVNGFIWLGKYEREAGVVGVAEDGA